MMDYTSAKALLFQHINPKQGRATDDRRQRTAQVLQSLDYQQNFSVIHVAGTKGKGSTCAMLEAALRANGYRVGLYTSPHLVDLRERIRMDGTWISEADFARLMTRLAPHLERLPELGFPDILTVLALLYFAEQAPDFVVMETHVGGRYDPSNVVQPMLTLITTLDYDHQDLLGATLSEITWHKAGIMKAGIPAISAPQAPEAEIVLRLEAGQVEAPLQIIGMDYNADWRYQVFPPVLSGQAILRRGMTWRTRLLGRHQAINLALVVAGLETLFKQGVALNDDKSREGLRHVVWGGRLELVQVDPLLILDGAHNASAAQALAQALDELFPRIPLVLVYAAKASKDSAQFLHYFAHRQTHIILTQATSYPTQDPLKLFEVAQSAGIERLSLQPDWSKALQEAHQLAGEQGLVCVTGSLYLVGDVRGSLQALPH